MVILTKRELPRIFSLASSLIICLYISGKFSGVELGVGLHRRSFVASLGLGSGLWRQQQGRG